MKAIDICKQLGSILPRLTDGFSNTIDIESITVSGTTATCTTALPHKLKDKDTVAITGAEAPVQIDTSSFTRVGSSATFNTLQDHDFTLSERDKINGGKTLTISGATEEEFNGEFQIARVVNRRELIISVQDSGATSISGAPLVNNANGGLFNGLQTVKNSQPRSFEYTLEKEYPLSAIVDNAKLQTSLRIYPVLDVEQFISDVYTKQGLGDDILAVQLGDVVNSKSRSELTDASTSAVGEYSFTPTLIQPFAIYVIMNITDQLTGSEARDKVEGEYIPAIFRSVLRAKFDTGFTYNQYKATFTGHGVFGFASTELNKAVYIHEIAFEQLATIDKVADTYQSEDNVAFRDVAFTLATDLGDTTMTPTVDLDEEPINE